MIDLLTILYTKIKSYSTNTYQNIASPTAVFPYAVFRVPTINENELREDVILEVDIWDNIPDTTRLENLTTTIDKGLNRYKYYGNSLQFSMYKITRLNIPDVDPKINRRQLRFQIQTFWKI